MSFDALPNVIAMVTSLAAMVSLSMLAARMAGGNMALIARLIALGVFFAVFLHAGSELAEMLGLLSSRALMQVMGVLLSLGSIAFCSAGILGVRALR